MEQGIDHKKIILKMKAYWTEHGLSQADAARKMGLSQQGLSNRLTRPFSNKLAIEFASYWPWSVKFLLTGEGELEIKEPEANPEPAPAVEKAPSTFELYDVIRQQADTIRSQQQLIRQLTERLTDNVPGTPIKKEELDILYRR